MIVSLKFITYIHTLTDPRHQRGEAHRCKNQFENFVHRCRNLVADHRQNIYWIYALNQVLFREGQQIGAQKRGQNERLVLHT